MAVIESNLTKMYTPWSESGEYGWTEHPRPQAMRKLWMNLNGKWEFTFSDAETIPQEKLDREIIVPFPWESALSGVGALSETGRAFYRRRFVLPDSFVGKRVLLHLDAVDWESTVYLNDTEVSHHFGGYDPVCCDITDALAADGEQVLEVKVYDPTREGGQPTGKQDTRRWNDPRGCMYVPSSGIWQPVWLEAVENSYIRTFSIVPQDGEVLSIQTDVVLEENLRNPNIQVLVYDADQLIAGIQGKPDKPFTLKVKNAQLWSPENPKLYRIVLRLMNTSKTILDEIETYTAFRSVSLIEEDGVKKIALNGKSYFQMGVLDQGYWCDGIYTPPCDQAQKWEISRIKQLGFNMIRKHAKVENYRWYYWCDVMGILVWQDMPSSFSTGMQGNFEADNQHVLKSSEEVKKGWRVQFEKELTALIDTHKSIPSIIVWTVFNEGWGEFDTIRMTEYAMSLDCTRLFIPNSGYNCSTDIEIGDIKDIHNYLPPKSPMPGKNRAVVCGEYGSLGYVATGHLYQELGPYHGMVCSNDEDAGEMYQAFIDQLIEMKEKDGLCAAVYTQWTDVENEINGIYTYDRKVLKLDENLLKENHQRLTGQK